MRYSEYLPSFDLLSLFVTSTWASATLSSRDTSNPITVKRFEHILISDFAPSLFGSRQEAITWNPSLSNRIANSFPNPVDLKKYQKFMNQYIFIVKSLNKFAEKFEIKNIIATRKNLMDKWN